MTHLNEFNLSAVTIEEILRNGLEAVREMVGCFSTLFLSTR